MERNTWLSHSYTDYFNTRCPFFQRFRKRNLQLFIKEIKLGDVDLLEGMARAELINFMTNKRNQEIEKISYTEFY